jgi:hypothetical protein
MVVVYTLAGGCPLSHATTLCAGSARINSDRTKEEFACVFTETGQPIDLIGGVKLTGQAGRLSFGLLDVQTEAFGDLKSKNLAVGRVSLSDLCLLGGITAPR